MTLEVGKLYEGFKLIEEKNLDDINSMGRIFEHEKSGARLFHLENEDDNKVFSIGFRTPPSDSTGVAHILEHSVLCGSRKFPSKEPFVELAKGSLNTFLNAMTFSDKTMYPVASRNTKDFYNLMDVYMDAVLYPNIHKTDEIMMQEGWHYELDNKDSELTYKGVVYNEMKGAYSSPERVLIGGIQESLFPDTTYGVESGGNPKNIPELTKEQFKDFHKKYYHPSNSFIYLYGDMDLLKTLSFINNEYLKDFDKIEVHSDIDMQQAFDAMKEVTIEYPISLSEQEEDKTYLSLNFVTGSAMDTEAYYALDILESMLLETPSAPLKKAIIDAKIGKDVFGIYDGGILQPVFGIIAKNANEGDKDKFKAVVMDTLRSLVREGLDKKLIESAINSKEFALREADYGGYPKGLIYNIKALDSWLYGASPMMHLQYEATFKKIRTALSTNYFEKLIEKYLLNNSHCTLLVSKPVKGLDEVRTEELKKELEAYKNSLSENELEQLMAQTNRLKERQNTPDSVENIEKLPLLSLKDIDPSIEKLPTIEKEESGIKILHHDLFTSGIAYVNLYFDTNAVAQEDIPYLAILTRVLGSIATETIAMSNYPMRLISIRVELILQPELSMKQADMMCFIQS